MVVREGGRREEYRGGDGGDAHDAELVSRVTVSMESKPPWRGSIAVRMR